MIFCKNNRFCLLLAVLGIFGFWTVSTLGFAGDWPEFRGPGGTGIYNGKALPMEWGPDKNVAWKIEIPGKGWSSPILWHEKLYLTTAVELPSKLDKTENSTGNQSAKANRIKSDYELRVLAIDATNGKLIWNKLLFISKGASAPNIHSKNSHASPTPVTDGEHLFVHFGHEGTAALKLQTGEIIWKKIYSYQPVHGNGGSPILVGDKLVFSCDGGDQQFVVALNKTTGDEVWKTARNNKNNYPFSFSTPQLIDTPSGKQIISSGSFMIAGYEPETGKEIWRSTYKGWSLIQRPVYGSGLLFYTTGYMKPILHAIEPKGSGDITSKIVWTNPKAVANTPSLTLVNEKLYMVSDNGMFTAMEAKTGKVIWSERLPSGGYSASPLYSDGKFWITNETGVGVVVKVDKEFQILKKNDLKEKTFASFVPSNGALFIRTEKHLYRFEENQ